MEDEEKIQNGIFNTDPRERRRWRTDWHRDGATKTVSTELASAGWRPMSDVPKNRYVALYFWGGSSGDFEGSGAYYLENNHWHVADSKMIFDASQAIAWKRWTKQTLAAEPLPSKGRRG